MATESLIVLLDAKTAKLDAKLKATDAKLDKLSQSTEKTDTSLNKMSASAISVGKALGVAVVAVGALTAGTVALIRQTTAYAKELKIASQLSGIATEKLEAMAFATATVGIGLEKLGDISKDTLEKVGDYLNTGGGGFQDFADAMKLTSEETKKVATEFSTLTGPDILQKMVTMMEDADVSAVQMSHALEGMASDTTNLIPLLSNSGEKMKELAQSMANVTVPLTRDDLDKISELDVALDLAGKSAANLANKTLVDLSEWFTKAANTASFFFATLNEGTRAYKKQQLEQVEEDLKALQVSAENSETAWGRLKNSISGNVFQEGFNTKKQNELLEKQWKLMNEIADIDKGVAPSAGGGVVSATGGGAGGANEDKIKAIADRFKEEGVLLAEKLVEELLLIGDNNELKLKLEEQFLSDFNELGDSDGKLQALEESFMSEQELLTQKYESDLELAINNKALLMEVEEKYLEDLLLLDEKSDEARKKQSEKTAADKIKLDQYRQKTEQSLERKNVQSLMSITSAILGHNSAIGKALFIASQGLAISEVFFNSQVASMRALAELGPIVGAPVAASIQTSGYISMAAIAATTLGGLSSSSGGGGSISSGGSTSSSREQPEQEDFQRDFSSLEVSSADTGGSSVSNTNIPTDSGDQLMDLFAELYNQGRQEGRYT